MYIDVFNGCFIRIEKEQLLGEKDVAKKALIKVKTTQYSDYKSVCKNVTKVIFGRCLTSRTNGPQLDYLPTKGCYVKGTKSVYINTYPGSEEYSVETISEIISKYSKNSKEFWQSYKD